MYRGDIPTPSWTDLSGLDGKVTPGMYFLAVQDGSTWGQVLIIGTGSMGYGHVVQMIFGPTTGAKYRVSNGYNANSWTAWKSF